jgi:hypothetical protein
VQKGVAQPLGLGLGQFAPEYEALGEGDVGPVVGFFSPDDGPGALRLAGALGGPIAGNSARSICSREAALRGWGP